MPRKVNRSTSLVDSSAHRRRRHTHSQVLIISLPLHVFKELFSLFRPPGTLVPKAFCFSRDVYLFIYFLTRHRISELRRPISAKLCTVIRICVIFLMHVKNLGGPPLKNLADQKHAKFGPISHNFRL